MLKSLVDRFGIFISNISERLRLAQQNDIDAGIVNRTINIDCSNGVLSSPYVLNNTIHFGETFLNFQWCLTYHFISLIELYADKDNYLSSKSKILELKRESKRGKDSLLWALSLRIHHSEWPDTLVNPNDDTNFVHLVNDIFLNSIAFIFFHEYGHIKLQHSPIKYSESILQENEADNFALNLVFNELENDEQKENYIIGAACCGLGLLYTKPNIKQLSSRSHPDIDIRIMKMLEYFQLKDSNIKRYVDKLLIIGFQLYLMMNKIKVNLNNKSESSSSELEQLIDIMNTIKQ